MQDTTDDIEEKAGAFGPILGFLALLALAALIGFGAVMAMLAA